jgi:putative transposase
MPDHFHLLITTRAITIERALQLIKGGFSYRVKSELRNNTEIWQRGFGDHRIRNSADYNNHRTYIWDNAVKKRLAAIPEEYAYCSANPKFEVDPAPVHLRG